jgi:hypothetical protein
MYISNLYNVKRKVENQTTTRGREDSSLCPENSSKIIVQEFYIWKGKKIGVKLCRL